MIKHIFLHLLFLCVGFSLGHAELIPEKGKYDPRVRVVNYNPLNVTKISTFYGVSTHVQFSGDEVVKHVAVGDEEAWFIVPKENNLFIKPIAEKADTNVTVITNKHAYQFALVVNPKSKEDSRAWSSPNLIYSLSFKYPQEELAAIRAEQERAKMEAAYKEIQERLKFEKAKAVHNFDYWVAGSDSISPTAAFDNGSFIFLTFSNNRDMPAIYSTSDGEESLINTNVINGNTIVVQRMVKELILRKGAAVASVVNRSFDLDGGVDNTTGTVSEDVQRVIKGGN